MVLRFFLFAGVFLFLSCADFERDNPEDQRSINYNENRLPSSSSVEPSSNSAVPSSSSVEPSSNSAVPSSSPSEPSSSSVLQTVFIKGDPVTYEGDIYETVVIGTQTWMARNLNLIGAESCMDNNNCSCYGSKEDNCATYGMLYDWESAMGACHSGWRLPSKEDWDILITVAGGPATAGKYLKTGSPQLAGFVLGGYGECNWGTCNFKSMGNGYWWSSNGGGEGNADVLTMSSSDNVVWGSYPKENMYSVRCVKD